MSEYIKDKSEIYKDLFPYNYLTSKENLTDTLVRLIFKAFEHGRMLGAKGDINKISIDEKGELIRITFEMIIDGKIKE